MNQHLSSFSVGPYTLLPISDGLFSIDAGTMYGNVARTTWSKFTMVDKENRMVLALNALLIRTGRANILVNAGVGNKLSEKLARRYRVNHCQELILSLAKVGVSPEDIDVVIFTHLHFDHCGGASLLRQNESVPTFPRARYIIQESEWAGATHPNELTRGGYLQDNILPLADRIVLVNGSYTLDNWGCPGIQVHLTGGHSSGHQVVEIVAGSKRAVYLSDLVPTTNHTHLPYVTGYDIDPTRLLQQKKLWLKRCMQGNYTVFWEHDTKFLYSGITLKNNRYAPLPYQ